MTYTAVGLRYSLQSQSIIDKTAPEGALQERSVNHLVKCVQRALSLLVLTVFQLQDFSPIQLHFKVKCYYYIYISYAL